MQERKLNPPISKTNKRTALPLLEKGGCVVFGAASFIFWKMPRAALRL